MQSGHDGIDEKHQSQFAEDLHQPVPHPSSDNSNAEHTYSDIPNRLLDETSTAWELRGHNISDTSVTPIRAQHITREQVEDNGDVGDPGISNDTPEEVLDPDEIVEEGV